MQEGFGQVINIVVKKYNKENNMPYLVAEKRSSAAPPSYAGGELEGWVVGLPRKSRLSKLWGAYLSEPLRRVGINVNLVTDSIILYEPALKPLARDIEVALLNNFPNYMLKVKNSF
ncbi:MAG TPA: hypothetical protein VJH34_03150 [archaeon]|nr:hypothetical protein [archaeon]